MMKLSPTALGIIRQSIPVVSMSGGKDSTAASLILTEAGIEHRRVFADTQWEDQRTYDYLDALEKVVGKIDRVTSLGMIEAIRKKKMFPDRLARYCTTLLKVMPLRQYFADIKGYPLNIVGIRAQESRARSGLNEYDTTSPTETPILRPLITWAEQDVIDIHQRHGLKPNPLYWEHGFSRVGCWPCIFARKEEIRLVAELDPARIDLIEALEKEIGDAAEARNGGPLEKGRPTYFQRTSLAPNGRADIRRVVAWSRTDRKGMPLIFNEPPPTCARWGFCM